MNRALFLDRDGVINVDHGYIGRPEDFDLVPGIIEVLHTARSNGYRLIVITNQSGIARGYFSEGDYALLEGHMLTSLGAHGVDLEAVYHCPHHPEGTIPELSFECSCRKPAPGMILRAQKEFGIDLSASILVGDKDSDVEAGLAAGVGRVIRVASNGVDRRAFASLIEELRA